MESRFRLPRAERRRVVGSIASGSSLTSVAAGVGVAASTVRDWWAQAGGMTLVDGRSGGPPRPALAGRPSGPGHRLSLEERARIQRGLDAGWTQKRIAAVLGRSPATICREIARHRSAGGDYDALVADARARTDARRPKGFKLADPRLAGVVAENMDVGWSPQLISRWLRRTYRDDRSMQVSHETIYRALYVQARGHLRADLHRKLSTGRSTRKAHTAVSRRGRAIYADALRISQRPAQVQDRAVPGHWEGDLVMGAGNRSAVGTLVERSTRFTILLHLPDDHGAEAVAAAMITAMGDLPAHLRRSLTWDRGTELAGYQGIQLELQMPVYFADPHSPWQRGTNENTNRLLRFWLEKGTDLRAWDPHRLRRVQDALNARPRPTLDLRTPAQALAELLEPAAA